MPFGFSVQLLRLLKLQCLDFSIRFSLNYYLCWVVPCELSMSEKNPLVIVVDCISTLCIIAEIERCKEHLPEEMEGPCGLVLQKKLLSKSFNML